MESRATSTSRQRVETISCACSRQQWRAREAQQRSSRSGVTGMFWTSFGRRRQECRKNCGLTRKILSQWLPLAAFVVALALRLLNFHRRPAQSSRPLDELYHWKRMSFSALHFPQRSGARSRPRGRRRVLPMAAAVRPRRGRRGAAPRRARRRGRAGAGSLFPACHLRRVHRGHGGRAGANLGRVHRGRRRHGARRVAVHGHRRHGSGRSTITSWSRSSCSRSWGLRWPFAVGRWPCSSLRDVRADGADHRRRALVRCPVRPQATRRVARLRRPRRRHRALPPHPPARLSEQPVVPRMDARGAVRRRGDRAGRPAARARSGPRRAGPPSPSCRTCSRARTFSAAIRGCAPSASSSRCGARAARTSPRSWSASARARSWSGRSRSSDIPSPSSPPSISSSPSPAADSGSSPFRCSPLAGALYAGKRLALALLIAVPPPLQLAGWMMTPNRALADRADAAAVVAQGAVAARAAARPRPRAVVDGPRHRRPRRARRHPRQLRLDARPRAVRRRQRRAGRRTISRSSAASTTFAMSFAIFADGAAVRPRALDLAARARPDLLLRFLLAALPDPRPDRAERHPAGGRISRRGAPGRRREGVLVRADAALARRRRRACSTPSSGRLAASVRSSSTSGRALSIAVAGDLLSLVHRRGAGLLRLSVGRHAARGGVALALPRAARLRPGLAQRSAAVARRRLPAALGVVPHLLRVGPGEAPQRRGAVAQPHRDGQVLRERSAADVARLVRAAVAAAFHAFTAGADAGRRAVVVVAALRAAQESLCRLIAFCIVTPLQIGIILTANYAFLNYLVLSLGVLLLDDRSLRGPVPRRGRASRRSPRRSCCRSIFLTSIASFLVARRFRPSRCSSRSASPTATACSR